MKLRTTITLLALAAGLLAFIKFYESKLPSTREATERSQHVVNFSRDDIDGIDIFKNEEKIELRKRDNQWFVDAPLKDRADGLAVDQLLSGVETMRRESSEEGKDAKDLAKDIGVQNANVRLKLLGKNAPPLLHFGKDTAVPGKIYARIEDSRTVHIVSDAVKNQISKNPDEFRDHRITSIDPAHVNRAVIKTAAGEIEVVKKGEYWQLARPLVARGDDQRIRDGIAQTLNARIESFAAETAPDTGLAEPRGTVTFYAEGADKPVVLQIGAPTGKDRIYAKLSDRAGVFVLPANAGQIIGTKPNDLRDRRLARLNPDSVDRVHIAVAGKPEIVLAREKESWKILSAGNRAANVAQIKKLMDGFQSQLISEFVEDVASDLPKYGLDKPQLKVTFNAFSSENTAESTAGETALASLSFGKIEGENVYARLEGEPFVISVAKAVLAFAPAETAQWQDLAVFKLKPEEITAIEVTKPGGQPVEVTRDEKAGWKLTKGSGTVNQNNADSLRNTLAVLHATRWPGSAVEPPNAFAKPMLVIDFTTADKKSHKVTIGAPTSDAMWNAIADQPADPFVLNSPDSTALQLSLTEPAPAPAETTPESSATPPAGGPPRGGQPPQTPAPPVK